MSELLRRLRHQMMGVPDAEITAFLGGDTPAWQHLERAVRSAVGGYHAVLDGSRLDDLVPRLDATPAALRGYAYEGAAMGLTGLDCFLPGSTRFVDYLLGPAAPHAYMAHIGAGEALARLRRRPEPFLARLADPVLRWLVMDGYGFHEGFFKPQRHVVEQRVPSHLSSYAARVFDQGVGRSIWFRSGAEVEVIAATIDTFATRRHADLWLGVGVACGYVGGIDREAVVALRAAAGPYADQLGVGTAFTAKGRHRAGNPVPDTEIACSVLCGGLTSAQAAVVVDRAFADVAAAGPVSSPYDLLQRRLEALLKARDAHLDPAGSRAA